MSSRQSEIRRQIRRARRSLSKNQQQAAAENLARRVARHRLYLSSRNIAFYWPNDGEIDPTVILTQALAAGKSCFLPVLYKGGRNRLLFGRVNAYSRFAANKFGIPEPDIKTEGWVYSNCLDLVLTPLVAFDNGGNRIGMGGGFYDTTLSHLRVNSNWQRPYVIGLAHELQHLDSIGRNAWDIPLRAAITDQDIYQFDTTSEA